MALWKTDSSWERLSPEEWNRRMMRRHSIQRWAITILQIAGIAGVIWLMVWMWEQFGI